MTALITRVCAKTRAGRRTLRRAKTGRGQPGHRRAAPLSCSAARPTTRRGPDRCRWSRERQRTRGARPRRRRFQPRSASTPRNRAAPRPHRPREDRQGPGPRGRLRQEQGYPERVCTGAHQAHEPLVHGGLDHKGVAGPEGRAGRGERVIGAKENGRRQGPEESRSHGSNPVQAPARGSESR